MDLRPQSQPVYIFPGNQKLDVSASEAVKRLTFAQLLACLQAERAIIEDELHALRHDHKILSELPSVGIGQLLSTPAPSIGTPSPRPEKVGLNQPTGTSGGVLLVSASATEQAREATFSGDAPPTAACSFAVRHAEPLLTFNKPSVDIDNNAEVIVLPPDSPVMRQFTPPALTSPSRDREPNLELESGRPGEKVETPTTERKSLSKEAPNLNKPVSGPDLATLTGTYYAPDESAHIRKMAEAGKLSALQWRVCAFLRWWPFDLIIGLVVLLDCSALGLSTQLTLYPAESDTPELLLQMAEWGCCIFYWSELCLRLYAFRLEFCMRSTMIKVDFAIATCALVDIALTFGEMDWLGQLTILRILRLLRIARAARLTVHMHTLWLLLSGLLSSVGTMFWTFVLISFISYAFAVLGVLIFPPTDLNIDTPFNELAVMYFGGMGTTMLTLIQVLTLDSVGSIYRPMILEGDMPWTTFVYFVLYILFVSVALMNLVTAVMVETALQQAADDKEFQQKLEDARKREILPMVRQMFAKIDTDGSGEVSLEELTDAPDELRKSLMEIVGTKSTWSPEEIFEIIDEDGSGSLQVDELLNGLLRCSQASEIQKMQMVQLRRNMKHLTSATVTATQSLAYLRP
eukprot:TRINITY_DN1342_c0_g1_i2.p1 TRINITY_DN1342_c0_g1~~TRINITY_DN1342_c0_g1_i2.p1  ORF type:complete len:631 (-),score=91.76 TRINITY_DN1342_c0_g1_i2:318-2210(-)